MLTPRQSTGPAVIERLGWGPRTQARRLPSAALIGIAGGYLGVVAVFFGVTLAPLGVAMANQQAAIVVSDRDNNGQVLVPKGSTLVVKLDAIPGTGYGWRVVTLNTDVLKPLEAAPFEPTPRGVPGGVEQQVFRFKGQAPGSTVLELYYQRPWEKDLPPEKTYRIRVHVR